MTRDCASDRDTEVTASSEESNGRITSPPHKSTGLWATGNGIIICMTVSALWAGNTGHTADKNNNATGLN